MEEITTLPAPTPASLAAQPILRPAHRILVVEDDEFIRQLTTQSLGLCGYQVTTAEDGLAGWHALNADVFDLMITDNNMPRLTGIGLLKKLRAARMGLPVIMATGVLPEEEFEKNPWLKPAALVATLDQPRGRASQPCVRPYLEKSAHLGRLQFFANGQELNPAASQS